MSRWKTVALGRVASIERNVIEPAEIEDGTLFVGLENISSGGAFAEVRPVASGELASSKFKFTERHVLYGKLRPYLAKIARPAFAGVCSTDILPILPSAELDRAYLAHYLLQPSVVAWANSRATGANLPRISPTALSETPIPLPSVEEQRRISIVLDKAQLLRAKHQAALTRFDELQRAIFLDMFGDPMTNPKEWPRRPIADLGEVITGNTPSRANRAYYGQAIEWIKADNLRRSQYYATTAAEGLSEAGKSVARKVPARSILVTCIAGSPDSIGNAAMTDREVAFNQQINALVPRDGDPDFLLAQIRVGKRLIQEASTGGMKGLVSKSRFSAIQLMSPPSGLQREFGRRVAAVERLKNAHRTALVESDALFASVQHRAFRGEL